MQVAQVVDFVILSANGATTLYSANRNKIASSPYVVSYIVKLGNGQTSSAILGTNVPVNLGDYVILEYLEEIRRYVIVGRLSPDIVTNLFSDVNATDRPQEVYLSGSIVLHSSPRNSEVIISPEYISVFSERLSFNSNQIDFGNAQSVFNILAEYITFRNASFTVNSGEIALDANELAVKGDTISVNTSSCSMSSGSTGISSDMLVITTKMQSLQTSHSTESISISERFITSLVEEINQKLTVLLQEVQAIGNKWTLAKASNGVIVRSFEDDFLKESAEKLVDDIASDKSAVVINKDTLDKINELVDAVNDLRKRVHKIETFIQTVFPSPPATNLISSGGKVMMNVTPGAIIPGSNTSLESLDTDNCLSAWMFSESKKNKKSSE